MSLRKPFRAVPIKPGPRYRANLGERTKKTPILLIVSCLGFGAMLGLAILTIDKTIPSRLIESVKPMAVSVGLMRDRVPQEGDSWSGCHAARAAGTAPIYFGEPGYDERMDGDGDGIACEPYF
jgi:Excalibur calcium-binding domain